MRHCIYCGMPIEEDDRFCVRCGKEQPDSSVEGVSAGVAASGEKAAGGTAPGAASGRTMPGGGAARGRHTNNRRSSGEKKIVIALVLLCLALAGVMGALLLFPRKNAYSESAAGTAAPAPSVTEVSEAEEEAEAAAEEARKTEEEAARKAEEEAARKAEEEAARKAEEEAAAAAAAQRPTPTDSSYILPESSSRNYSYEELNQLDDYTLQMAINEIYARHGRRFSTPSMQEYFDNKTWYNGTIAPEAFDGNEGAYFNGYESANRELMARIREQRAAAAAAASQPAAAQPAAPAQ